jgi:hypothetical protein
MINTENVPVAIVPAAWEDEFRRRFSRVAAHLDAKYCFAGEPASAIHVWRMAPTACSFAGMLPMLPSIRNGGCPARSHSARTEVRAYTGRRRPEL